eukprot:TRINITY_DN8273_c1_g1_i9.p1 TRINITY_DN8273_c1_g1~~TRINITY_DN8273_c1_g1_i9.p1  ORF type:complete len:112 (+),score=10.72 TRINITY_DN8273_c1_g1_i9:103-438(+)
MWVITDTARVIHVIEGDEAVGVESPCPCTICHKPHTHTHTHNYTNRCLQIGKKCPEEQTQTLILFSSLPTSAYICLQYYECCLTLTVTTFSPSDERRCSKSLPSVIHCQPE